MNNRINPYNSVPVQAYRSQAATRPEAPTRSAQPPRTTEASSPQKAATGDLSGPERQMIARYFPASDALSLRLYGPDRGARTLTPTAVGARLDVQG